MVDGTYLRCEGTAVTSLQLGAHQVYIVHSMWSGGIEYGIKGTVLYGRSNPPESCF